MTVSEGDFRKHKVDVHVARQEWSALKGDGRNKHHCKLQSRVQGKA